MDLKLKIGAGKSETSRCTQIHKRMPTSIMAVIVMAAQAELTTLFRTICVASFEADLIGLLFNVTDIKVAFQYF